MHTLNSPVMLAASTAVICRLSSTVGWANFIRRKFRHIRNRYTNEKIERINLHICALKTKFFPHPVSVEVQRQVDQLAILRETLAFVAIMNTKLFWAAAVGEELECRREPTNLVILMYGPLF